MANRIQRLVMWWRDYDWMVKFYASMIFGSMGIALLFTGAAIFPLLLIDFLIKGLFT